MALVFLSRVLPQPSRSRQNPRCSCNRTSRSRRLRKGKVRRKLKGTPKEERRINNSKLRINLEVPTGERKPVKQLLISTVPGLIRSFSSKPRGKTFPGSFVTPLQRRKGASSPHQDDIELVSRCLPQASAGLARRRCPRCVFADRRAHVTLAAAWGGAFG